MGNASSGGWWSAVAGTRTPHAIKLGDWIAVRRVLGAYLRQPSPPARPLPVVARAEVARELQDNVWVYHAYMRFAESHVVGFRLSKHGLSHRLAPKLGVDFPFYSFAADVQHPHARIYLTDDQQRVYASLARFAYSLEHADAAGVDALVTTNANDDAANMGAVKYVYDAENKCCVCLAHYVDGDRLGVLACGHAAHAACLCEWSAHAAKPSCPLCRRRNTQ